MKINKDHIWLKFQSIYVPSTFVFAYFFLRIFVLKSEYDHSEVNRIWALFALVCFLLALVRHSYFRKYQFKYDLSKSLLVAYLILLIAVLLGELFIFSPIF